MCGRVRKGGDCEAQLKFKSFVGRRNGYDVSGSDRTIKMVRDPVK